MAADPRPSDAAGSDSAPSIPDPAVDETAVAAEPASPPEATPEPASGPEAKPTAEVAEPEAGGPPDKATPDVEADRSGTGRSESATAHLLDDPDFLVVMSGVSRKFDDRVVVRDIDLAVSRGTILGIIGPSGAGKTTTIRMLTGALDPTTGDLRVLGRVPRKFRRRDRERIGYMPQQFTLYTDLTAGENIDFVASLFGLLWRRRRRRVREVLKVVDLWDARGRQAGQLSGGMQRRLELACALVHEPELIILDEPTAGIDPLLRATIWDELHRLRDAGRTLLVTTQHIGEADECDAVALIVDGGVIALAAPDDLRRLATNGDVLDIDTAALYDAAGLMGTEGVREINQDGPRHVRVTVDNAGTALPIVVDKIRSAGVEVASAREHRLSFDEIFAVLVARHEASRDTGDRESPGATSDRTGPTGEAAA